MRRTLLATLCLFAIASASSIGRADGDNPNIAAALQKFDEGRSAFDAHDYAAALTAFDASNKLLASPNSLLYVARCYAALGKTASAYTTYLLVERQASDRITANADKRYIATRDSAVGEAAELEAKVPKLTLAIPGGLPAGFVVKQNGQVVPDSSWGIAVDTDPGPIAIDASGPRIKPFHLDIDLQAGEKRRVDVLAERVPTAVVSLQFKSRPAGLSVELDGAPVDEQVVTRPFELDTGVCKIDVTAPGYRAFHWQKDLSNGETETVTVSLTAEARTTQRGGGTPKWMFFAAAGGAVAATGVGTFFALRANGASNSEQDKNPYARDPATKDSIQTQSSVANVLFISGAVLGAGACVLAFTTQWKTSPKNAASVTISPLGLTAVGRF